jgi:hypothetical protein
MLRSLGIGTASLALCLILALPAHGQSSGNGLYEPFPRGASIDRAERFVQRLDAAGGASTSTEDLERGAFRGDALAPAAHGAASGRATGSAGPSTAAAIAAAALLALVLAAAAARTATRRYA